MWSNLNFYTIYFSFHNAGIILCTICGYEVFERYCVTMSMINATNKNLNDLKRTIQLLWGENPQDETFRRWTQGDYQRNYNYIHFSKFTV